MDWLSARVAATPQKIFLHVDSQQLSFAEVDRLVAATCVLIQKHRGIQPEDRVAILLPPGLTYVLTLLALLRLRAVSVPLNTRLTAPELAWQVNHVDCRLLITQAGELKAPADIIADVLELPRQIEPASAFDRDEVAMTELDTDFAIIHTSGTSGRPKAAVLTLSNIYHSALASAFRLGVLPDDRWLCVLPLYHVGGMSIILRSLIYGTAVELMTCARFDVEAVNRLLSDQPISLVSLVPTMLGRLLDGRGRPWNPQFRLVLLGGEATSATLLERSAAAGIPVATSYGLSEASSQVATAPPALAQRKPGTVGKPLLYTHLRLVDENGKDLPSHSPGEILIKGPIVMRGYLDVASLSREALRDGWLHTGDMGYLDADGDLFILQRRSDLIVSGGENIYPAEVEAALRAHPAVAEALVFGLQDASWGQRPAAVIELVAGASASAAEITTFARERLAGYKIPRAIAFVEALPRTGSGKIQRREAQKVFHDAFSRDEEKPSL